MLPIRTNMRVEIPETFKQTTRLKCVEPEAFLERFVCERAAVPTAAGAGLACFPMLQTAARPVAVPISAGDALEPRPNPGASHDHRRLDLAARPEQRLARLAGGGAARPRAQSAFRHELSSRGSPAPEFTSLCPVTGQPDFAHPRHRLCAGRLAGGVEVAEALSQRSFRNHGAFHEDCTDPYRQAIWPNYSQPKWLRIGGYWYPRGGMPIDVFWQTGEPPKGLWLPDQGVAPYRGR